MAKRNTSDPIECEMKEIRDHSAVLRTETISFVTSDACFVSDSRVWEAIAWRETTFTCGKRSCSASATRRMSKAVAYMKKNRQNHMKAV